MGTIDVVAQARASFAQRSWGDAYERFTEADALTTLELGRSGEAGTAVLTAPLNIGVGTK